MIFIDTLNLDEQFIKLKVYDAIPIYSTLGQQIDQPLYIYNNLIEGVNEMTDELNNKWGIKLFLTDSENILAHDLLRKVCDKYTESEILEELFSVDNINEIKRNVSINFVNNLEKYNIPTEKFSEIKSEGLEKLSRNLDEQFEKSSALDAEERLETLCDEWQCAYSDLDYDLMNEKVKDIKKFYKGQYLYKDENLIENIKYILTKNGYINKKMETGDNPLLSELEEEVLKKI